MPLSCWLNCITIPMISGVRSVGEQINSINDIELSDCWARSSARISSMSSSTAPEARRRRSARRASSSHCLVINKYLQNGWSIALAAYQPITPHTLMVVAMLTSAILDISATISIAIWLDKWLGQVVQAIRHSCLGFAQRPTLVIIINL